MARNFELQPSDMEKKPTLPSLTVPDETKSLKEIIDRYTRTGQFDASLQRNPTGYIVDDADLDDPDLSKELDLVERQEMAEHYRDRVTSIKDGIASAQAEASAKRKAEAKKEEERRRLAEADAERKSEAKAEA